MSKKQNHNKKQGNKIPLLRIDELKTDVNRLRKSKRMFVKSDVNNKEYMLYVDQNFLESKKNKVVDNTLAFVFTDLFRDLNDENAINVMLTINVLCEFTSLAKDNQIVSFEEKILAVGSLRDLGIYDKLVDFFPQELYQELYDRLEKELVSITEEIKRLPDELEEVLANEDLTPEMQERVKEAIEALRDGE